MYRPSQTYEVSPFDAFEQSTGQKPENCFWDGISFSMPTQPCAIAEFFKQERMKPPHLRSKAAYIHCTCPRCNPICM